MKDLKALEILKDYKNIDFGCNVDSLHLEIEEAISELEALENRSCMNCKHNEITICKKLPSIDWSFEPTNDFYCSEWKQL